MKFYIASSFVDVPYFLGAPDRLRLASVEDATRKAVESSEVHGTKSFIIELDDVAQTGIVLAVTNVKHVVTVVPVGGQDVSAR